MLDKSELRARISGPFLVQIPRLRPNGQHIKRNDQGLCAKNGQLLQSVNKVAKTLRKRHQGSA